MLIYGFKMIVSTLLVLWMVLVVLAATKAKTRNERVIGYIALFISALSIVGIWG